MTVLIKNRDIIFASIVKIYPQGIISTLAGISQTLNLLKEKERTDINEKKKQGDTTLAF